MSVGLQLLSSVIRDQSRALIRTLTPDLFVQEENGAFQYFLGFYRQHGGLPSFDTMRENGFPLPPAMEPPSYYLERATNRAIYNGVRNDIAPFQQALARQNGEQLRDLLMGMASRVSRFSNVQDVFTLPEAAEAAMNEYAVIRDQGGELPGVTLGWPRLDELTGGAMPGEVITWVARPNIGKSYTVAKSAIEAHRQGRKVLLVSMEMGAVSIARRIIGIRAGLNPDFIKRGTLSMWGEQMVFETIQAARNEPPFILVSGNLTKTAGVVDALIQEHSPDVVYIDAQYLMKPSNSNSYMKKHELLDAVGVEIQQIALGRQVPLHQTVQFNREQGKGQEGDLAKIGGTDTVGQISSVVIAIGEGPAGYETTRRIYGVIKNREGRLGQVTTNFRFDPIDFSERPAEEDADDYEAQVLNQGFV